MKCFSELSVSLYVKEICTRINNEKNQCSSFITDYLWVTKCVFVSSVNNTRANCSFPLGLLLFLPLTFTLHGADSCFHYWTRPSAIARYQRIDFDTWNGNMDWLLRTTVNSSNTIFWADLLLSFYASYAQVMQTPPKRYWATRGSDRHHHHHHHHRWANTQCFHLTVSPACPEDGFAESCSTRLIKCCHPEDTLGTALWKPTFYGAWTTNKTHKVQDFF